MKIYLAGRMSGMPEGNFPAFRAAAYTLRQCGHEVVSPVEMNEEDAELTALDQGHPRRYEFLARDLRVVADPTIEAVVVLPGWQHSEGARLEVTVARGLGKPVLTYPDLEPVAEDGESVLAEAERIVNGARSDSYGHPADHSSSVADLWRAAFGWDADAYRVNLAMMLFKIARADTGRGRDSLVDACGYARTAEATLARRGLEGFKDLET